MPDLATLGPYALYTLVTALVFAESGLLLGFFLPGDTVLFAAGLLAGQPGAGVSLAVLLALVVPAAVVGDMVGYAFGHRAGLPLLQRRDGRVLNARNLERARAFYARYGSFAVVAARFVPWVRTFTPILAGVGGMRYRVFLAADVAGALCWGAGLLVLGRLAADVPVLRGGAGWVAAAFVVGSGVLGVVHALRARRRASQAAYRSRR